MNDILLKPNFIQNPQSLFELIDTSINWDNRMKTRKTASFGKAYNYSQMSYPFQKFPDFLEEICQNIKLELNFEPNNCLINYYENGKAKMGYHSDQIGILAEGTGIVIISLGETRILKFRNIEDKTIFKEFELPSGSLLYMNQETQNNWQHSIPKSNTENPRMSLTFRKLK
ncbi:alpha-ketoglutarate-dependent dioxygenase AlkB [Bernardetia sp. OM2101]|uniref:alpha-ketoglutarate-dependent dioxygenase AlkB n=1 Tax=Bernardetia sp. OM2101 TaxID=3344876 RepID=UPI0035CE97DF